MDDCSCSRGRDLVLTPAEARSISIVLRMFATPSRLVILSRLLLAPSTVGELVVAVGTSQSAVSHQLALLRGLGMVVGRRRGHTIVYSLNGAAVSALARETIHLSQRLGADVAKVST